MPRTVFWPAKYISFTMYVTKHLSNDRTFRGVGGALFYCFIPLAFTSPRLQPWLPKFLADCRIVSPVHSIAALTVAQPQTEKRLYMYQKWEEFLRGFRLPRSVRARHKIFVQFSTCTRVTWSVGRGGERGVVKQMRLPTHPPASQQLNVRTKCDVNSPVFTWSCVAKPFAIVMNGLSHQ